MNFFWATTLFPVIKSFEEKTETTSCFGMIANSNTYLISYFRVGGRKNTIWIFLDQPHVQLPLA